ncbi:GNAT family N-acetyltransferase [Pleomorphomonas diazotrophica]|uniref:GNAT family N-acetyltransferase n=1 Tax=Pleomorphomonas diazotrophica TaxID=1166257 RepID=A0A1I4SBF1_9HYPH|nr:N-acetyltransferase [Pleomorphomonas diazotrophica]PKR88829.1 GNAT family N-acetyltransferase [Pleomorphomonas diazotrophica]SFM61802.1 putative acetyltransferase [Pleomorphomonas diazotrophica]
MSFLIRIEAAADRAAIGELTAAAFLTAAHASGTEAAIVRDLRAAGALGLSLVAVDPASEEIVGHVGFSPVETDMPGRWFGLGPLSVAPARQRSGIGSALVRAGLERLAETEAAGVVLVGDPAYYGRLGFAARTGLACEGVPDPYVQAMAFREPPVWRPIAFHPAFFTAK